MPLAVVDAGHTNMREGRVTAIVVAARALCGVMAGGALLAAGGSALTSAAPRQVQAVALELTARRFAFQPDRLEVVEGDLITLAVKSADGTHGIEIKKLKLKKEVPRGGSAVMLTFTAPAPGAYEITCSEYCGRGHDDMKATLVVKPRSQ
jgi:cytochrome c oxidase subunit 2